MATNIHDTIAAALGVTQSDIFNSLTEDLKLYPKHIGVVPGCFEGWKSEQITAEHRKNMSLAASKRIRTKDHIDKLHDGRRNSKNSPEHKAAILASRVGSKHSEESKKKMGNTRKNNSKVKELASEAGKASVNKRPPDYKEIQSLRMKLWWAERKKKTGGEN